MGEINYRNPGEGAIEFAITFVEGLSMAEALPILRQLKDGELHDAADKRIKRCEWCGYYYRDKTKPNNSKVCGPSCKFAKDNLAKAIKKADAALLKPKKAKSFQQEMYTFYSYWLEYPAYLSEHYMLKRAHRYETPFSHDKLEQIDAAKQRGYKKKSKATPTDGSDKVQIRGIRHGRSYGEVEISQLEPDYFAKKYSEEHLKQERRRAVEFSRSKKMHI
ncbi:hypothetical protein ACT8ZR_15765 [Neobacillus sp. M.A.Huq-85]